MSAIKIVEVGPRDGLQNISQTVPTNVKIDLIQRLAACGLTTIEATSFVSPKAIPQLADSDRVLTGISTLLNGKNRYPVLVPNVQGLERAKRHGANEVAVFVSATEGFSRKNINCTVEESLVRARRVLEMAKRDRIRVRGYISCIFADPYDGPTPPSQVLKVAKELLDIGCYEISLGDTTGVGTPGNVQKLFGLLLKSIPAETLAGHFHDTYGQAIANVVASYQMGIRTFDSSVAGLGGCPFAKGAKGNLSTEDLVYTMEGMGIKTGVDLQKLVETGVWISSTIGIQNSSRAGAALWAKVVDQKTTSSSQKQSTRTWEPVRSLSSEEYSVQKSGPAVKVSLTRPKNGNALTTAMIKGLTKLYTELSKDDLVFYIVLTGTGKFFCTGMDLKNIMSADEQYKALSGLFKAIDNSPKTTIAAVNGDCYGGGVGLAFVCDLRILQPSVNFKLSEVRLGLCPATISKYVIREWGIPFARAAMLTGRSISASELGALQVLHGITPEGSTLDATVDSLLDDLKSAAPKAAGLCKDLIKTAWADAGRPEQDIKIRRAFDAMLAENSESKHGVKQFQKGVKSVDWEAYWNKPASKL